VTSPDVSVVIPTHARCERLPLTLASALGQTGVDHEVIVVDDGSTDGTAAFLAGHPDPRLRVVRHDTARGMSAARNAGAAVAHGRWLAFLDDDDLWAPCKLAAQLDALAAVAGARWSAVGSVVVDGRLAISGWKRPPPSCEVYRRLAVENVVPGGGSGVLVEASLFVDVGGFDSRFVMLSDRDLWFRLARSPVASVDRPLLAYVVHGTNLSITGEGHRAELVALEAKYRHRGEVISVVVDTAVVAARQGHRFQAARLFAVAAAHHRDPRWLVRAALAAGGTHVEHAARAIHARAMPRRWRIEAERWLGDLTAGP